MGMEMLIGVGLSVMGGIFLFQWMRQRQKNQDQRKGGPLPESLSVEPRVILSKAEAALFNVIRLAAQDSYLVFAKLPLRQVVKLDSEDKASKRALLKSILRVTVNFVLVHPGTLTVAWVILVKEGEAQDETPTQRELLEVVCREAGIDVLWLDIQMAYTVPQLVQWLGLAEEE